MENKTGILWHCVLVDISCSSVEEKNHSPRPNCVIEKEPSNDSNADVD